LSFDIEVAFIDIGLIVIDITLTAFNNRGIVIDVKPIVNNIGVAVIDYGVISIDLRAIVTDDWVIPFDILKWHAIQTQ